MAGEEDRELAKRWGLATGLAAVLVLVSACDRVDGGAGEGSAPLSERTEGTANTAVEGTAGSPVEGTANAPVEPVEAVLTYEPGGSLPNVSIRVELPGHWHYHNFFRVWFAGDDPREVQLLGGVSCGGLCRAPAIPANLEAATTTASIEDRWSLFRDVRASIEIIEEGEFPGGRYSAYRVTYPPAPEGADAPWQGTNLECYLYHEGDAFYAILQAMATPEKEAEIWPVLLDSCRGASYWVTE